MNRAPVTPRTRFANTIRFDPFGLNTKNRARTGPCARVPSFWNDAYGTFTLTE